MWVERNEMAGMGSSETRVRLCNITSPLVCTTFRLCLKRIQPNPPALVGIGAANRSAVSTRKQMSAQIPDSDWRTANLAGKAHATGVGYLKYVLIHKGRLKTMSSFAASPACLSRDLSLRLQTYPAKSASSRRYRRRRSGFRRFRCFGTTGCGRGA